MGVFFLTSNGVVQDDITICTKDRRIHIDASVCGVHVPPSLVDGSKYLCNYHRLVI